MKTSAPRSALAAILAWLVAPCAPAAESLSVLLQKAIYAEETEGNLDSAIRIYEQIAADGAANRSLIAQAQFRLAVCFQKQGRKEQAIGVLNELLRQFPAETVLAAKAREQLASLGHAAPETVTLRKVSVVKNMWVRGVSPGGRYIAFTGDNGEVYMQEPALGKTWLLLKCNWDTGPWDFAFSPDERRVVYDLNGTALYVCNVDASDRREIHKPGDSGRIWAYGWQGTSGHILAELEDGAKKTKSFVSIDEKSGELKRLDLAYFTGVKSLSRDGRYLAHRDGSRLDIVDLESGRRSVVVEDQVTGLYEWAHGDAALYFRSDRTGQNGLWVVPVEAGKATGEAQLVKEQVGEMWFQNIAPDGRIYYGEGKFSSSVWVASVNFETGELTDEPRLVTDRFPGMQASPAWSHDGTKVWLAVPGEQPRLVSVSMSSGRQEEIPLWLSFRGWGRRYYSVSPDGTFVLIAGNRINKPGSANATYGIHRLDLATSKVDTLKPWQRDDSPRAPHLAADGNAFYYIRETRDALENDPRKNRRTILTRRELASGAEKTVCERGGERRIVPGSLGFSPDGSRLAFITSDFHWKDDYVSAIELLDLRTGGQSELLRMPSREWVKSLSWAPDGRRLIYAREIPANDWNEVARPTIWITDIESRKSVPLKLPFTSVDEIAVHPDGHQIAFRSGSAGEWAQLWVMEGVTPPQRAERETVARPKVIAQSSTGTIPLGKLSGPNNSIFDPTTGLRAAPPTGWELSAATRLESAMRIDFKPREEPDVSVRIVLNFDEPKNLAGNEIDTWLRTRAEAREQGRRNDSLFGPSYRNLSETVVARSIMGRPALRWNAEFSRQGDLYIEYNTLIYWERGSALVFLTAPAPLAPRYRLAYESLAGSTSLNPITRTALALGTVCKSGNAIHDEDSGLRAILPAALKPLGAGRTHHQFHVVVAPVDSTGWGLIRFLRGNPVDVPASEVDGWLREWARLHQYREAAEEYSLRLDSFVSRIIGGRPAVVYRGDFNRDFAKWTEYLALIYHPDGVATVQLQSPVDAGEETREIFHQLIDTVRLP